MQIDHNNLSSLCWRERHQLMAAAGIGLLFAATAMALGHGFVSALQMALSALPPLVVGLALAVLRRWPAAAAAAALGGLALLALAGAHGVAGPVLLFGLILVVSGAAAVALLRDWSWLLALANGGAALLLWFWWGSAQLGTSWLLAAVAAVWLCSALASLRLLAEGKSRDGAAQALGGAALLLSLGAVLAGPAAALVLSAGLALVCQGWLLRWVGRTETRSSAALRLIGAGLVALAAFWQLDLLGLTLGLGAACLLAAEADLRSPNPVLRGATFGLLGLQLVLLGISHPGLRQAPVLHWHLWAGTALLVGLQLIWMTSWLRPADQGPAKLARASLPTAAALLVCASLSTELSVHVHWVPALNLLWTGLAGVAWLYHRRSGSLGALAPLLFGAALLKLILLDWLLLGGATRVLLMMSSGTGLLLTAVLNSSSASPRDDEARSQPPPRRGTRRGVSAA